MLRSVILGMAAGVNIVIIFLYQWYVITLLGAGAETDALFGAMVVPQVVLAVVSGSLSQVLVPLLASMGPDDIRREGWNFFQAAGLLFTAAAVVLAMAAPVWVPRVLPGFSFQTLELTVRLVRIQLPGVVFTAVTGVLWSVMCAQDRFVAAEAAGLLAGVAGFAVLYVTLPLFGIEAAAWSLMLRTFLQALFLLPCLGRYCRPAFGSDAMRRAWSRMKPLLAGTVYYKTDQFVDRFLSSMTPAGGLSLLALAVQIYSAANTVLARAVSNPMVTRLARLAKRGRWQEFMSGFHRCLAAVMIITGLAMGLCMVAGPEILGLVFGSGRFSPEDTVLLWQVLMALGGVLVGGAAGQILSSSFYACGNTVIPTRIGVAGFTFGIIFKIGGFYQGGIIGIAMGTSAYYVLNSLALYFFLKRHVRNCSRTGCTSG